MINPQPNSGAHASSHTAAPSSDHDAIRAHVELLHTLAGNVKDDNGAVIDGIVTLTRIENGKAMTERFAIGDVDTMCEAAIGWADNAGVNLYAPFAVFRKNLPTWSKGHESDVRAVLAFVGDLDSDQGKTAVGLDALPIEPAYVIESSANNFQPVWPLSQALSVTEGKPLAEALSDALGGDCGTKDVSHIWRIPGTLNWPTPKKLKRGRSPIPQLVTVHTSWHGVLIDAGVIWKAVEKFAKPQQPNGTSAPNGASSNGASHPGAFDYEPFMELPFDLRIKIVSAPGRDEDRSETAASAIWQLFKRGWSDDAIEAIIRDNPDGVGQRYTPEGGGKDLAADIRRLRAKWEMRYQNDDDDDDEPGDAGMPPAPAAGGGNGGTPPPTGPGTGIGAGASGPTPTPSGSSLKEIPEHLLDVPGLVGEIKDFIVASAIQPQPGLALMSGLVLVGTVAGRHIAGPTRSGTHLYGIGLAESGGGKDHPISMIPVILRAAGLEEHIGPSQFISMPAAITPSAAALSTLRTVPPLAAPLRTLSFWFVFSFYIPLSGLKCGKSAAFVGGCESRALEVEGEARGRGRGRERNLSGSSARLGARGSEARGAEAREGRGWPRPQAGQAAPSLPLL